MWRRSRDPATAHTPPVRGLERSCPRLSLGLTWQPTDQKCRSRVVRSFQSARCYERVGGETADRFGSFDSAYCATALDQFQGLRTSTPSKRLKSLRSRVTTVIS